VTGASSFQEVALLDEFPDAGDLAHERRDLGGNLPGP
jgi:hypothetical protein